jgi:hypothetical protein
MLKKILIGFEILILLFLWYVRAVHVFWFSNWIALFLVVLFFTIPIFKLSGIKKAVFLISMLIIAVVYLAIPKHISTVAVLGDGASTWTITCIGVPYILETAPAIPKCHGKEISSKVEMKYFKEPNE